MVDEHKDERGEQDTGHDERPHVAPGDLPVQPGAVARHLVDVVCEPKSNKEVHFEKFENSNLLTVEPVQYFEEIVQLGSMMVL